MQVGWIWGIGSGLGILVGFIGGPVGDRFGPRRTLFVACLLMGIAGLVVGGKQLATGYLVHAYTSVGYFKMDLVLLIVNV